MLSRFLNSLHRWHVSKFAKKQTSTCYYLLMVSPVCNFCLQNIQHAVNAALAAVWLKLVEVKQIQYCSVLQLQAMDH